MIPDRVSFEIVSKLASVEDRAALEYPRVVSHRLKISTGWCASSDMHLFLLLEGRCRSWGSVHYRKLVTVSYYHTLSCVREEDGRFEDGVGRGKT